MSYEERISDLNVPVSLAEMSLLLKKCPNEELKIIVRRLCHSHGVDQSRIRELEIVIARVHEAIKEEV